MLCSQDQHAVKLGIQTSRDLHAYRRSAYEAHRAIDAIEKASQKKSEVANGGLGTYTAIKTIHAFMAKIDDEETTKIPKLKSLSNWPTWKMGVKFALIKKDVDRHVYEEMPIYTGTDASIKKNTDEWNANGRKALAILGLHMEPSQQLHIESCKTGREAYMKLVGMYDTSDESSNLARKFAFLGLHMNTDESVNNWISRVEYESTQCKLLGVDVATEETPVILNGLTPAFHISKTFILNQGTNQGRPLTLAEIRKILVGAEMSGLVSDSTSNGQGPRLFMARPYNTQQSYKSWQSSPAQNSKNYNTKSTQNNARDRNDRPTDRVPLPFDGKGRGDPKRVCQSCGGIGHVCNHCKIYGHHTKDCRHKQAGRPAYRIPYNPDRSQGSNDKKGDKSDPTSPQTSHRIVNMVAHVNQVSLESPHDDTWVLDTGADHHIIGNYDAFIDLSATSNVTVCLGGKNNSISALGIGTAELHTENGLTIRLSNAYYVPEARFNLLSVSSLTSKGAEVAFTNDGARLHFPGIDQPVMAPQLDGLWYIKTLHSKNGQDIGLNAHMANTKKPETLDLWHQRLGHISEDALKHTAKLTTGLQIKADSSLSAACAGCELGKAPREPFKPSSSHSTIPLGLLHIDIAGPMKIPTITGARYFFLIMDDFSRFVRCYIITRKSDAYTCLKQFFALCKIILPKYPIAVIRSDNDSVFTSNAATIWYKDNGIQHELSVPHSPQQNGRAERSIRDIRDVTNSLIQHAKTLNSDLDDGLWGEAVLTATWIRNRTYKSAVEKTPYETLFGIKPDLSMAKVYGCKAYVHIDKTQREGKFAPQRALKIFCGYPEGVKGWKFYDPETNKFSVARDANFIETTYETTHKNDSDRFQELPEDPKITLPQPPSVEGEKSWESNQEQPKSPTLAIDHVDHVDQNRSVSEPMESGTRSGTTSVSDVKSIGRPHKELKTETPTRIQPFRTRLERPQWSHNIKALLVSSRIPVSYTKAMSSPEVDKWKVAIDKEMQSILDNNTFELTDLPQDRQVVGSKWVFDIKPAAHGRPERYKARLVAQGYSQVPGIDYQETFAPVASYDSVRVFLSIVAIEDLELVACDVDTAFLYGVLDEEIYMKQPQGYITKVKLAWNGRWSGAARSSRNWSKS